MADEFDTNLMRMIAAELYLSLSMQAAREMFAKGYFALGAGERAAVDEAVVGAVGGNFRLITPALLKAQAQAQPVGFQAQSTTPPASP